jgi:glutathione synthase/RimK-type ligase-like ATP-grasp enzyme
MSKSLLILTPNPEHPSASGRWPYVLETLREALGCTDVDVFDQPWSEPVTRAYDLISPMIAWGYHNAPDEFKTALAQLVAKGHRVLNPAAIVAWNIDKRYLLDLAEAGVRIIPTAFTDKLTEADITAARADFGQKTVVIKPVFSAGAKNTLVWDGDGFPPPQKMAGKQVENAADTDGIWISPPEAETMIQPFMPSVQSEGEWSLLFFGGVFSHAILKTPKAGDFRSQPDYAANLRSLVPPPEALELAHAAIDYVGREQLFYARVDMVRDTEGRFCLMELELIEPDLYLAFDDNAPEHLSHALEHILHLSCSHDNYTIG